MTARSDYPTSSKSGTFPSICSPAGTAIPAGTFFTPPDVTESLATLLWPRIDHDSYGWKLPNGDNPQISREKLDRTFAARTDAQWGRKADWRGTARPLTRRRLSAAILGGQDLYLRGAWNSRHLLVRIDIDAHHAHQDDASVVRSWADAILGGLPFWCGSERGESGYVWLTGFRDHRHANQAVSELSAALGRMAKAKGFRCGIEAKGSFLLTEQRWEDNQPLGPRRVCEDGLRGSTAKLPRVHTLADVERLARAEVSIDLIEAIIRETPAPAPMVRRETSAERRARWAALEREELPRGRSGKVNHEVFDDLMARLARDNAKHRMDYHCHVRAGRELGISSQEEAAARRDELFALGLAIYESSGYATGERTRKRECRSAGALRKYIAWFDDELAGKGGSGVWFTEQDVADLQRRLRGMFSNATLRQNRMNLRMLAVVASTMRKNTRVKDDGACPTDAIKKMLQHFGITDSGSLVKRAVDMITSAGVFTKVREASKGVCRAFRCVKHALFPWCAARPEEVEAGSTTPEAPAGKAGEAQGPGASCIFSPGKYRGSYPDADDFEWAYHIGDVECEADDELIFADCAR